MPTQRLQLECSMKPVLFTIGYEGKSIDEFTSALSREKVRLVLDVRENPFSWKSDFRKATLERHLRSQGFQYVHLPELGTPRRIRRDLKNGKSYSTFFDEYSEHLRGHEDSLIKVTNIVQNEKCCLLCMEKDASKCHRRILAGEIKRIEGNGLEIVDL